MKNKVLTVLAIFSLCLASAYAEPLTDLSQWSLHTNAMCGEFAPEKCIGVEEAPGLPRFVHISYRQNDPETGEAFMMQLYEIENEYVLALFEGSKGSLEDFCNLSAAERIQIAKSKKVISKALAESLYEGWGQALMRATYLNIRGPTTSTEYYYLSLFSHETNPIAAESLYKVTGRTTGYIAGIAIELRNYLLDTNESELWQKILLGKCNAYLRYAQSSARR